MLKILLSYKYEADKAIYYLSSRSYKKLLSPFLGLEYKMLLFRTTTTTVTSLSTALALRKN